LCGLYFRRYRAARGISLPVGVIEEIYAQFDRQRSYTRDKFTALWNQQPEPEPELERLRRRVLACLVIGYAVWGLTVFAIIPRLF